MTMERKPLEVIVRYVYRLEDRVGELLGDIQILRDENKELKQWQSDNKKK